LCRFTLYGTIKGVKNTFCVELYIDRGSKTMDLLQDYIKRLDLYKVDLNQGEFESITKEIDELLQCDDVEYEKKVELCKAIVDILQSTYKWKESIKILLSCADIALTNNDYNYYILILIRIIAAEMKQNNYEKAYSFIELAVKEMKKYNIKENRNKRVLFFNMAITCAKLEHYEEAIKWAQKLQLEVYLEPQELIEVRVILATCYKDTKDYKNAEAVYWSIIASAKFDTDRITIGRTYRNLSELKYEIGNIKEAEEYLNIAMQIDLDKEEELMLSKYYAILIMIKLDKVDYVHGNFNELLNNIFKLNNRKRELDLITQVIQYYIKGNYQNYLEADMNFIEESILTGKCNIENMHDLFFDVGLYFKDYSLEKSFEYFDKKVKIKKYFEQKSLKNSVNS
jgi:tetratricopeptide (TPR) repeat protein